MFRAHPLAWLLSSLFLLSTPDGARATWLFGLFGAEDDLPSPGPEILPYSLKFDAAGADVVGDLQDASDLYRLRMDPPPNGEALSRRVAADLSNLLDALWANGFYDASVRAIVAGQIVTLSGSGVDRASVEADKLRGSAVAPILIQAIPGKQFKLRNFQILDAGSRSPLSDDLLPRSRLNLGSGDPARASAVRALELGIVDRLRAMSHPMAKIVKLEPTVYHDLDVVDVTVLVDVGPQAGVGAVAISGATTVDPAVVRSFIYLEEGEAYSPEKLAAMRKSLATLDIIGSARILESETLDASGNLPLEFVVNERKRHAISASAQYSTVDGPSVRAAWTDRNVFGAGERLRLEGTVGVSSSNGGNPALKGLLNPGRLIGRVGASFIRPAVWGSRNDFLADVYATREVTPGYTSAFVNATTAARHRFDETLYVQGGLEIERGRSTDPLGQRDYTLVGAPISVRYDTTDNPLDPTRGVRVIASAAGYPKLLGSSVNLIQGKAQASTYYAIDAGARTIFAGRVAVGSLEGAALQEIPDSRRFFAGGGGSVRGFSYRSLRPLGPTGIPIGGKSLLEASLEARFRVTDSIGIVPFVDAGGAFASSYPDFRGGLRYAVGLGLRYYTGFGPIRLDVAMPISRRAGESPVAVYVSVGQSF
jgi:translocation and assembly module TamA